MTQLYSILKASKLGAGAAPDMYTALLAQKINKGGSGGEAELSGVPPLTFLSNGTPLLDYLISGNTTQNGTPTPDNPIMPQGAGERTGNLFDYVSYFDSTFTNYNQFFDYADLQLSANTTYTLSTSYKEVGTSPRNTSFIVAKPNDVPTTTSGGISSTSPITITTGSDGKLRLYKCFSGSSEHPTKSQFDNGEWLMLNTGSTALPYEPYGIKIPILSAGQTTPVYLGEVQTTRNIGKLVLTGEENWLLSDAASNTFYTVVSGYLRQRGVIINICSHYTSQSNINGAAEMQDGNVSFYANAGQTGQYFYVRDSNFAKTNDLKTYLQQQYANGTPVTVWYVLANEETAVVNEPLMRIGDYADTLSKSQAGVQIPTNNGTTVIDVDTTVKPSEVYIKYHTR